MKWLSNTFDFEEFEKITILNVIKGLPLPPPNSNITQEQLIKLGLVGVYVVDEEEDE